MHQVRERKLVRDSHEPTEERINTFIKRIVSDEYQLYKYYRLDKPHTSPHKSNRAGP